MRMKNMIKNCKIDKLVNEMIRLLPDWITGQSGDHAAKAQDEIRQVTTAECGFVS